MDSGWVNKTIAVLEAFKMEEESSSEGVIVQRRRRESKYCDHCKQFISKRVSKSTFYSTVLILPLSRT